MSILMVNFGIGFINSTMEDNTRLMVKYPQFEMYITQDNRNGLYERGMVSDEVFDKINSNSNVEDVVKYVIAGGGFKWEDELVSIQYFGYDISSVIEPWDCTDDENDLLENLTAIVDVSIKRFIPDIKVGDMVETPAGLDLKIVGFCDKAIVWAAPVAWMSLDTAKLLIHTENLNVSTSLAVDLKSGYSVEEFESDIEGEDVKIIKTDELIDYELNEVMVRMGSSVVMMVIIGFVVAMIIISATMLTTVLEKTPQLVTLKALGASHRFINSMFIGQVLIYITLSTIIGSFGAYLLTPVVDQVSVYGLSISIPWAVFTYGLSLILGIFSALFLIRRVNRTDPAVIFRA